MAFPQTEAPRETIFTGSSTTHNVVMPATVDAGDLLLMFFHKQSSTTATTPGGWTKLATADVSTGGAENLIVYGKIADGTEDGASVNVATNAATRACAQVYRIFAGTWAGVDLTANTDFNVWDETDIGSASRSDANPNPPSLSPSWGAKDTLWIAAASGNFAEAFSAAPTDYTDLVDTIEDDTTDTTIATARRELNAASNDPSTFTKASTGTWVAVTVAIEPFSIIISPSPVTIPLVVPAPTVSLTLTISPSPVTIPLAISAPVVTVAAITFDTYQDIQRLLDPSDYGTNPNVYLEVHGFTNSAIKPFQAHLYNVTDVGIVAGSEISSTATSITRLRSAVFNLAAGPKTYEVRYGGVSGGTYTAEDAVLIIDTTP